MPPLVGGVAISSGRLYDNLKEEGWNVEYYNIKPAGKWWQSKPGIVLRFSLIPFWILFRKRYDIIHCHVPGTIRKLYLSLMKSWCFKGADLIYTLHGDVTNLLNKWALYAMSKADRIICVQPGDSKKLPGSLREKSVDIPAFIIPKTITESNIPEVILRFVKKNDAPLILFYGGVVLNAQYHDLYGVEDMVNLYFYLKESGVDVRLLMLVNYSKRGENICFMEQIRRRIQGEARVMMVENARIPMLPLFRYADVYVRPSKTDGDSLAVREALSLGCPVVASGSAVRPQGTFVYADSQELRAFTLRCLNEYVKIEKQPDFYEQIKCIYQYR